MSRYQKRSTISLVVLILVIAIIIAGVFTAMRAVLFPADGGTSQANVSRQELLNTASNHSVSMYVRGPIVGNDQHGAYQMNISPTVNSLITYVGYEGKVVDSINVANNQQAYSQFVYALDRANFADGNELTGDENNTEGICATGLVYYFSINVDGKPVKTLWATSCGGRSSLRAEFRKIKPLFDRQFESSQLDVLSKINL